jgi:scyllo-inositol 2-dehydrogenase (NADP+)
MDDLRVAIVGYGLAGRHFHAPLVAATPGMAVSAVLTGSAERAAAVTVEHPAARVVASVDELWGQVDLLVLATPNPSHVPLAQAAIDHRVAVVVDKPLAVDARSAARLWARATEAAVPLSVFHNRRWDSDLLTLARLLAGGALGRVLSFESRFERWRPDAPPSVWRAGPAAEGGGLLLDLGSHLVDQALVLFGPVSSVYAELAAVRPGHTGEDDAFLALTHAGGVKSHLRMSAVTAAPGPRMRVLGTAGAFVIDGLDSQEDALVAGRRPDDGTAWGREPASAWGRLVRGSASETVPSEPGDWPAFYRQMEACLRGQGPVPVEPADAVAVLDVLGAARVSAASGSVVSLETAATLRPERPVAVPTPAPKRAVLGDRR